MHLPFATSNSSFFTHRESVGMAVLNGCNPTLTTNTSVAMTWVVSSNGGDDVSHYAVVWSEDLNFTMIAYSKNLFVVDNSELSQKGGMVTVPGLSGGTTYYAKVVARNCVGASVPATYSCSTRCGQCICE